MIQDVASRRWSLGPRLVVAAGLVLSCVATLTPTRAQQSVTELCLICGEVGSVDAFLNILLFMPLGLGLGLMRVSWWKALSTCVAITIIIEALQFSVVLGRDASVGDVVMNSLGGAMGFALGRHWMVLLTPGRSARRISVAGGAALWVVVSALTGYSLQPRPTDPPFFGQLARQRTSDPPYPGVVSGVMLGQIRIPDERIPESPRIRDALRTGQPFAIRVTPRAIPSWFSPIARVADRDDAENAVIAAAGEDAVFRVRTNASLLRLRPFTIGVPDALQSTGHPLTIVGTFHRASGRLVVAGDAGSRESSVVFSLGSGWRLILPFDSVANGSAGESVMDVLWFSLLTLPIAYWCTIRTRRKALVLAAGGLVAALVCGLLMIDWALQLPAVMTDVAGVVAGVAAGALLSRFFRERPGYQSRRDNPPEMGVT